jgi:hypothetical protein
MSSKTVEFMSGKIYWAKITGNPVPNYSKDGLEWTFEFEPDEKGVAILKKHKLVERLKNKEDAKNPDKGKFLVLKQKQLRMDGTENDPIRIYDADDKEWNRSQLIGNGSLVDVKLDIRDYGPGKKHGIYPAAVRVTDLVAYESSEFGAMDGDDKPKPKGAGKAWADDELNDEIPL